VFRYIFFVAVILNLAPSDVGPWPDATTGYERIIGNKKGCRFTPGRFFLRIILSGIAVVIGLSTRLNNFEP
jgi:hypothetical protein